MACEKHGYTNPTFCPACDLEVIEAEASRPVMDRCPIGDFGDPHFCLGYRCQLTGICDYNRRHATAVKRG